MNQHKISMNKASSSSIIKDLDEHTPENERTVIQKLMQTNQVVKKEIEDIRQQMKQTTEHIDQAHIKMIDDDEYSTKLQQYKTEALTYKQEIEACQVTIIQLQKTIQSMEKQIEQLKMIKEQQKQKDHRFIHELFHLCLKYPLKSSPSHQDMKTHIQETFNHLIKRSSKINFDCKCSDRINPDHYPSYQYCLNILEKYQRLFNIKCFTQIPISLINLYHKYGELNNFIHSISSTIGVDNQNEKLVIETLEKIVEDSKPDEMNSFKRLAKIKHMDEAVRKIHSHDNFVPYYHQFIEQIVDLLEVSKSHQIIPAIKTLKLLAHTGTEFQWSYKPYR